MKPALLAVCIVVISASASASPRNFLSGLSGDWSGSGRAYLKGLGNIPASCTMKAGGGSDALLMDGRCGVLFYKIPLGLQLKDAGGGKFTGVYTGSRTGPAALSGMLDGNKLTMNITWGGEVNGDRSATMILQRTGADTFSQTVFDKVGGKQRQTSKFTFRMK